MLKRSMLLVVVILAYTSSVEAQSYLCIADKATGFSFNKRKKDWEITRFDVSDDKYILTKKWLEFEKSMRWTWTKVGENSSATCGEKEDFTERGFFRCEFEPIIYMNRQNMRFQVTYPYGYPNGDSEEEGAVHRALPAQNPFIEIGRCAEVK